MRRELISEALTCVGAEYIAEAAEYSPSAKIISPRYKFIKLASCAACICLIASSLFIAYSLGILDPYGNELNGSASPDGGDGSPGIQDGCGESDNADDENGENVNGGDSGGNPAPPTGDTAGGEDAIPLFDMSIGHLRLEITDVFTKKDGYDVLRISLYNASDTDEIFFRSSREFRGQEIIHILPEGIASPVDVEDGIFRITLPERTKVSYYVYLEENSFNRGKRPSTTNLEKYDLRVILELAQKNADECFEEIEFIADFSEIKTV